MGSRNGRAASELALLSAPGVGRQVVRAQAILQVLAQATAHQLQAQQLLGRERPRGVDVDRSAGLSRLRLGRSLTADTTWSGVSLTLNCTLERPA